MEEYMPTVSIVLPSYNGSKYIRESIDSIREQSYTDWELIIVDDCSKDNTMEIAREYEKKDNRIRVIHNEVNRKLPSSLNIGFEHAKGKYLTWTSDDNRYLPDALAIMVKRLEKSDVPMVCADAYAIDENGKIKADYELHYQEDELCRRNSVGACFLYQKEILDDVGKYDTDLFCVEDYDYWLRIKKRYGRIEHIERILYEYRYHEASLSSAKKEKIRRALIDLRKKHLDFILDELKDRKKLLYIFYYEMLEKQTIDGEIKRQIQSCFPELKNDVVEAEKKYIIFGAGDYGERAFGILKDETAFYADNNCSKVGSFKNGKEILSFEKMIFLADQYNIMIAIHYSNIYQLVCQLSEHGIYQYCTLQTYMSERL